MLRKCAEKTFSWMLEPEQDWTNRQFFCRYKITNIIGNPSPVLGANLGFSTAEFPLSLIFCLVFA